MRVHIKVMPVRVYDAVEVDEDGGVEGEPELLGLGVLVELLDVVTMPDATHWTVDILHLKHDVHTCVLHLEFHNQRQFLGFFFVVFRMKDQGLVPRFSSFLGHFTFSSLLA